MSLRRRDPHGRLGVLSRQGLVSCGTKEMIAGSMPAIISSNRAGRLASHAESGPDRSGPVLAVQFGLFQRMTFLLGSPPGA
jgi:hypothetical protein